MARFRSRNGRLILQLFPLRSRTVETSISGEWHVSIVWAGRSVSVRKRRSDGDVPDLPLDFFGGEEFVAGVVIVILFFVVLVNAIFFLEPLIVFFIEVLFVLLLLVARVLWRLFISKKWMVEAQSRTTSAHYRWHVQGWRGAARALEAIAASIENGNDPVRPDFDVALANVGVARETL